jgi:hypothetical protein
MQVADANTLTNLRMDWESEDRAVMILHDANQLKFVNKQLRLETRSLVLRYNDIIFHNIRDTSLFLSKCSTWYYEDFRTFKIQKDSFGRRFPHSIQDPNFLRQVFNFCRQAPHVQVQNLQNVTDIPYAYSPFFPQEATTLRYVMRNQKDWRDILIPRTSPFRLRYPRRPIDAPHPIAVDKSPAGAAPSNFRLLLPISMLSSERQDELLLKFRKACLKNRIISNEYLPYAAGGIDRWVELAVEILRDGI